MKDGRTEGRKDGKTEGHHVLSPYRRVRGRWVVLPHYRRVGSLDHVVCHCPLPDYVVWQQILSLEQPSIADPHVWTHGDGRIHEEIPTDVPAGHVSTEL